MTAPRLPPPRRNTRRNSSPPELLNVNEVADLLGCSARQVWRMADAGHLPRPIKLGKKLRRWPRMTIETWLADQVQTANRHR